MPWKGCAVMEERLRPGARIPLDAPKTDVCRAPPPIPGWPLSKMLPAHWRRDQVGPVGRRTMSLRTRGGSSPLWSWLSQRRRDICWSSAHYGQ
jgi:hypothetical protein